MSTSLSIVFRESAQSPQSTLGILGMVKRARSVKMLAAQLTERPWRAMFVLRECFDL